LSINPIRHVAGDENAGVLTFNKPFRDQVPSGSASSFPR
jgi:hypothetical protein